MKKIINISLAVVAIYFIVLQIRRYYNYGFHLFLQPPPINGNPSSNPNFNAGYTLGYIVGSNAGVITVLIVLAIIIYRRFFKEQSA